MKISDENAPSKFNGAFLFVQEFGASAIRSYQTKKPACSRTCSLILCLVAIGARIRNKNICHDYRENYDKTELAQIEFPVRGFGAKRLIINALGALLQSDW